MNTWSFGDWCLFFYNVLAGTVFLCQIVYFSVLGLRVTLKDRKIGSDLVRQDEEIRDILRTNAKERP